MQYKIAKDSFYMYFLSQMLGCKLEGLAFWYELSSVCLPVCLSVYSGCTCSATNRRNR